MNKNYEYNPIKYFSITFIATYILWAAGAFVSYQEGKSGLYILFMLPGLMMPFLVSLWMIFRSGNSELKKDYINRLKNPKLFNVKMLPAFILIMPLVVLASVFISIMMGGPIDQLQFSEGFSFSTGAIPVLLLLMLAAGFEELGWRGYAFDSLMSRFNLFKATLIFSILWSLWHFPLVFVYNSYQYEVFQQSYLFGINFFVSIVPMGFIISWMCVKNGKSVISAILFHFIVNMSQEMLAITQSTKCIETVLLTFVAAAIVVCDRRSFFAEGDRGQEIRKVEYAELDSVLQD